jgi:hypothetical protein
MRLTNRILPGLLAGSLLLGFSSSALAAKHSHAKTAGRAIAYGQVSNLSTGAFTLTFTPKTAGAAPKTWQVATTTTTKEIALKGTTAALTSGDYALVLGTKSTAGIAATNIRYSATAFPRKAGKIRKALGRTVRGTANGAQTLAVGGTLSVTITHKAVTKTLNFVVTSTTKFRVGKSAATTTPLALTAGQKVAVHFRMDATVKGQLDALVVAVPASA